MTTTTEIRIPDLTIEPAYFGEFIDDFDVHAIQAEWLAALQDAARLIAPSVTIHNPTYATAAMEDAEAAYQIDWDELRDGIDFDAIAQAHER
jgi:hypothetical protein